MAANTSKRDTVASLAGLNASAIDLINKSKRTPEMIQALLQALQLFKENRLGSAVANPDPTILLEQKRLRERFRQRTEGRFVNCEGQKDTVPLAALKISWRASACAMHATALPDSLEEIVKLTKDQIYRLVGLNTMKEFSQLLAEHGMYFAMTEEHIRQAFGD